MGMSVTISAASAQDAEYILKLQYLCYQNEAELYGDYTIEPLTQTLDDLRAELDQGHGLVARLGDEVVASVRGSADAAGLARFAKLIVHPRLRRHGLGGRLLDAIEAHFAAEPAVQRFQLRAGHLNESNLRLYRNRGYVPVSTEQLGPRLRLVTLEKAAAVGAYAASA
ncbi:GNAT family N-acetyltransferase [Streptomyces sp. NPDC051569]|uniref:GNAT family N-acetyltransferase n=1 Tax=Streptomyces sp. NPDC051569 TaxID=3365661 RepID=UPI0037AC2433